MRVLQEFLICFIREFRFVFPVMATLLCMCLFIYFKSDVRRMQEKSSKIIFFLLSLMLEIFLISAVLNTVAIRTRHLPVRVMAVSCLVLLWGGILYAIHRQIRKKIHE